MADRKTKPGAAPVDGAGEPDVLLDVPALKVDSIHLRVDDLDAQVALKAKVLDLVTLDAGVDVHLDKLRIDIKGVEAQALLKVRLDRVAAIVDRVLTTVDRNPELLESLGRAAEEAGAGAGQAVGEAGDAVESVGEGAGEAVGGLDRALQGVGGAAGQLTEAAGSAPGGGNGGGGAAGLAGASASDIAKLAAKAVAGELKASAKEEAKGLRMAAARKAKRAGERRRRRKAERLNATEGALRAAAELDVDLRELAGSGAAGRVTARDVRRRARED